MKTNQEIALERWHAAEEAKDARDRRVGPDPRHLAAAEYAEQFLTTAAVGNDLSALAYAVDQVINGGSPEYHGGERPPRRTKDITDMVDNTINRILQRRGLSRSTVDISILKVRS